MTRGHLTSVAFLALLICCCECWATSECRNVNPRPSVRPHNSTHLEVSWEGLFSKDCSGNQSFKIELQQVTPSSSIEDTETIPAGGLSEEKVLLERNPCHQYNIRVRLPSAHSMYNEYNFVEEYPEEAFGGYLKENLKDHFCYTGSHPLKIPKPLNECVINNSWAQSDQMIVVSVKMKNPKDLGKKFSLNITFDSTECQASEGIFLQDKAMFAGFACAALVLIALVIVIFLCKRRPTKPTPPKEESDLNDMYGQYEFDDINGGLVRMDTAWGTDKSPSYGQVEDNRRSQVQVMDHNEDYD